MSVREGDETEVAAVLLHNLFASYRPSLIDPLIRDKDIQIHHSHKEEEDDIHTHTHAPKKDMDNKFTL